MQISFSRVENGAKSVPIRIALAQINPRLGDVSANLALYEEKIRQAAKERADFLLFPELSLTEDRGSQDRAILRPLSA